MSATNQHACSSCGLLQANLFCQFCREGAEAAGDSPASPVECAVPSAHELTSSSACVSGPEQSQLHPPVPSGHFPTEAKLLQRQKRKALKEAGCPVEVKRKSKHVEQHFDDCGEDFSSLCFPVSSSLLSDSDTSEASESDVFRTGLQKQLNAFETWTHCGSSGEEPPLLSPDTCYCSGCRRNVFTAGVPSIHVMGS